MKCAEIDQGTDIQTAEGLRQIETHLACRLMGCVRELQVDSRDDGLIIRGQTSTYYIKQLVQEAVMEVTSMPILANEIEVC
jgi:hypothetical protein